MAKKLIVLFDANPLATNQKSGIGYYTYHLISALANKYPNDIELVGHYFNFLGRRRMDALPHAPNIRYRTSVVWPGKILNILRRLGFELPLELLFKQRGNAALFTNFVSLPSITRIPKAIVIHDLCFIDVPEHVSKGNRDFLRRFVPRSIKRSAHIITISNATKLSIQKHYDISDKQITITPIPPSKPFKGDSAELKVLNIRGNYILFVGTLEPRKNIINLVKAYEKLPEITREKYSLVLAGGEGWHMESTIQYIHNLQSNGLRIVTPGYVSELQRATLYENASLVVMPSHYEGFGMPILEAMSYKVPTAVSDIDVHYEVAGEASAYFNKDDPSNISECINTLLNSPDKRQQLVDRGNIRLKDYDWDDVAEKLYGALNEII